MRKLPAFCLFLSVVLLVNIPRISIAQPEGYWQQHVDYLIHVTLDDVKHELTGDITMTYVNNSPDALSFIYMHLWPNAYLSNSTAFAKQQLQQRKTKFQFAKKDDKGYIDGLAFTVDGKSVDRQADPDNPDIVKIILNTPVAPGGTITITTPFHVKIPETFSRLGHEGQQYQITQWYPKPAVYDRKGWHPIPYLDQGEFYSEFGNYDVFITLPANYVVGASGDLQNESEKEWLAKKASQDENAVFDKKDLAFPPSATEIKTLEYKIENAHDFAWFADKRYHVLKGEVQLPESGRTVTTYTYFTNLEADLWKKSIEYVNRSVLFYSDKVGDYGYNVAQAVEGALSAGAGMEYPTITIIGKSGNAETLDNTITHEVGHNWFYGMLGFNERDHAWMDEGINSYYEEWYMKTYYTDFSAAGISAEQLRPVLKEFNAGDFTTDDLAWYLRSIADKENIGQGEDLTATDFTSINYGLSVYIGTAFQLRYLAEFLTQPVYDRIMHHFFDAWKYKHPYPEDMKKMFEKETGENFGWFFDDLLKASHNLDYSISGLQQGKTALAVDITNHTDIIAPYSVSIMDGDSILHTEWYRGHAGKKTIYLQKIKDAHMTAVVIDAQHIMPDDNRENNNIKTGGIFKRLEPLNIRISPFSADNPRKTTITALPIIGFNKNDGFMAGLGIWNSTLPVPKIEYVLAPLYGFSSDHINGQGSIGLNLYPETGWFSRIRLSESASSYTYNTEDIETVDAFPGIDTHLRYIKAETRLEADIRKQKLTSPLQQTVMYRGIYTNEEYNFFYVFDETAGFVPSHVIRFYNDLNYTVQNNRILFPYSGIANFELTEAYSKLTAEFKYKINYPRSKKGVDVRLFGGTFFNFENDGEYYQSGLIFSGASGYFDYLYDEIFLGRNQQKGIYDNQIMQNNGFFKLPGHVNNFGYTQKTLAAANIEAGLPVIPAALYFDAGYTAGDDFTEIDHFQYEGGIMLRVPDDFFEIYFPLFLSSDLEDRFGGDAKYGEKIAFTLHLNRLNAFELMRKLRF